MKLHTAFFIAAGLVSAAESILSSHSVAAASPLPPGNFSVMFYSDKADLTPYGQRIIKGVSHAPAYRADLFDVIDLARTPGVSDYDRALSDRRAKAVVAQLVADGVPKAMINIYYVDNHHPNFPAAHDLRDPHSPHRVVFIPYSPPPPGVTVVP